MQFELIGCTSAGKSTLALKIMRAGRELGLDIQLSDGFVLKLFRLNWLKNEFAQRRLIELMAFGACLVSWRKHRKFCNFAIHASVQAPGSWLYKASVARIALKKIGIYEIIRRFSSDQQIILLDNEGVLQAAHALFVHGSARSRPEELSAFVQLTPLPDVVVYLRQPKAILIERVLKRGHHRLANRSYAEVERFVGLAEEAFEALQHQQALRDRMLVIDGEYNLLEARKNENNPLLDRVSKLILASLNGVTTSAKPEVKRNGKPRSARTTPHTRQETMRATGLAIRLLESLNRAGIEYCHWKSNFSLAQTLAGELDLDLLVDRKSLSEAFAILLNLGFKAAIVDSEPATSGIFHYYGLDPHTGKLIHVHLFSIVLTGESFVKSHLLPFEMLVLGNRSYFGPIRVPSKPAELILFILRTFIKYGSLPDALRLFKKPDSIIEELGWLLRGSNLAETLTLLKKYCPVVEEPLFLKCLEVLKADGSWCKRIRLAYAVRRRLRVYAKNAPLKRVWAYAHFLWSKMRRRFTGNRKNKKLHSGGAMIAFVGADATGKSTLVSETGRWLGKVFAARTVHIGKPPSSWLTAPIKIGLPLTRRLWPQMHRSKVAALKSPDSSQPRADRSSGILHALRAVALAWDRRRLVMKARRATAHGEIVICDRYPTAATGAMDSPRLWEQPNPKGGLGAFYNRLVRFEQRLYRDIPPPDVVLQLKVSLETAKQRNRTRLNADKDSDEYLEIRHQQSREWSKAGTKFIDDIDTERSIEETMLAVKHAIWQSL